MRTRQGAPDRGFSLVEALIASLLIATAVVGLAQLVALAARQSLASRQAASALSIAQAKLEQLRRAAWTYDAAGGRVSSGVLSVSPLQSLREDADGYVDFLDVFGQVVAPPVAVAHFARRWAIAPLAPVDVDTLLLQVCVFAGPPFDGTPAACVAGIRTRQP
jgi:type II secretory pathway pseudopilin PulG